MSMESTQEKIANSESTLSFAAQQGFASKTRLYFDPDSFGSGLRIWPTLLQTAGGGVGTTGDSQNQRDDGADTGVQPMRKSAGRWFAVKKPSFIPVLVVDRAGGVGVWSGSCKSAAAAESTYTPGRTIVASASRQCACPSGSLAMQPVRILTSSAGRPPCVPDYREV